MQSGSESFFPADEPALRKELAGYLDFLGGRLADSRGFRALLLGGGYGRGEGGIFREAPGSPARLFNDLEFYLFADAGEQRALRECVAEGERRFGIEIEIRRIAPAAFARARPSMFYCDLLNGHLLVKGDSHWVASLPAALRNPAAIPPEEASRLLVNRGMSLLRCMRWARGERDLPPGFCERIAAKLRLALADAVLCLDGRHDVSCVERHRRLASCAEVPDGWEQLVAWHAQAVEFKFHPGAGETAPESWRTPLDELRAGWIGVFLWCESKRMRRRFQNPESYADYVGRLFPEEPAWANLIRQARDRRRGSRLPFGWGDHPRAAIWKALALLLAASRQTEEHRKALEARAARLLGAPDSRCQTLEEHCRSCWSLYP